MTKSAATRLPALKELKSMGQLKGQGNAQLELNDDSSQETDASVKGLELLIT